MVVTLKILTDIAGKPDKTGKPTIIKRNVQSLRQFETTMILPEQLINSKGNVSKKWCFVKEGDTYFKLAHKYEDIEKLTTRTVFKGFAYANTKKI